MPMATVPPGDTPRREKPNSRPQLSVLLLSTRGSKVPEAGARLRTNEKLWVNMAPLQAEQRWLPAVL